MYRSNPIAMIQYSGCIVRPAEHKPHVPLPPRYTNNMCPPWLTNNMCPPWPMNNMCPPQLICIVCSLASTCPHYINTWSLTGDG